MEGMLVNNNKSTSFPCLSCLSGFTINEPGEIRNPVKVSSTRKQQEDNRLAIESIPRANNPIFPPGYSCTSLTSIYQRIKRKLQLRKPNPSISYFRSQVNLPIDGLRFFTGWREALGTRLWIMTWQVRNLSDSIRLLSVQFSPVVSACPTLLTCRGTR